MLQRIRMTRLPIFEERQDLASLDFYDAIADIRRETAFLRFPGNSYHATYQQHRILEE